MSTVIMSWQGKGGGGRGRGDEGQEEQPLITPNNPHLAGGEQRLHFTGAQGGHITNNNTCVV